MTNYTQQSDIRNDWKTESNAQLEYGNELHTMTQRLGTSDKHEITYFKLPIITYYVLYMPLI